MSVYHHIGGSVRELQTHQLFHLIPCGSGGLAGIPLITPKDWDPKTLYGDNEDWNWIIRMAKERGTLDMGYTAPNFNEVRAKWAEMRQAAWSGDMTVEAASAEWEKKANEILNRK